MEIQHYTKIRKEKIYILKPRKVNGRKHPKSAKKKKKVQSKVAEPQQQAPWIYNFRMNPYLICLCHQGPFVQIGYIKSMMTAKCG